MLDIIGKVGYRITSDGELINISDDNKLILSYHPQFGETILGFNKPQVILEVRKELENAQCLLYSSSYTE